MKKNKKQKKPSNLNSKECKFILYILAKISIKGRTQGVGGNFFFLVKCVAPLPNFFCGGEGLPFSMKKGNSYLFLFCISKEYLFSSGHYTPPPPPLTSPKKSIEGGFISFSPTRKICYLSLCSSGVCI